MFLFLLFLMVLVLLVIDYVYMGKGARIAFRWIGCVYFGALLVIAFKNQLQELSVKLSIARGVDLFIYPLLIILLREFFISRYRQMQVESKLTQLVREIAINEYKNK